ncbi:MAG: histidine phosphatase family protein [Bacilli bacterium]|nr:histidine phosphatase family protein [Bacilli bacterium]
MKLYVIRHGRTDANDKQIYNGSRLDEDINEVGIKQAKEAGKLLQDKVINLVFSSPLRRTRHTLELLRLDKPVVYDERLKDRDFGELTLAPVNDELCNMADRVETEEKVYARVVSFLEEIKDKYANDKNILIVTHGEVAFAISKYFASVNNIQATWQKNCEIREYNW